MSEQLADYQAYYKVPYDFAKKKGMLQFRGGVWTGKRTTSL